MQGNDALWILLSLLREIQEAYFFWHTSVFALTLSIMMSVTMLCSIFHSSLDPIFKNCTSLFVYNGTQEIERGGFMPILLNLVSNKHNELIVRSRNSEIAMTLDFKSNDNLQYIDDFCIIQYSSGRCWAFLTFIAVTTVFEVFSQFSGK